MSKQTVITVYDAGPAVFDYSRTNAKGERDPHVIAQEHRAIAKKLEAEFSTREHAVRIDIIFPTDERFIPTPEELANRTLLSRRIADSCERDIRRCDILVGDLSPWPKTLAGGKESVMSDEGTAYEVGFAAGIHDTLTRIAELGKTNPLIRAAQAAIFEALGLPKIVVPYNTSPNLLETRMEDHYDGQVYTQDGLRFSHADHTLLEECGDKNNAMLANAARKQGLEPQASFEDALRVGVEQFLKRQKTAPAAGQSR